MNVLSLFDGISCGRIALKRSNFHVDNYYSSEIDINSIEIANYNYPQDKINRLGDINNIDENILKSLPQIDLVIGGSPCQGFSRNGNMLNFKDIRSKLFFEYIRILNWIKENNNPNIKFLLENVEMKKEWKSIIDKYLEVDGVLINSKLLSAQNRPRLYWTNIINDIPQPSDINIKLLDILDSNLDTTNFIKYKQLLIDPQIKEENYKLIDNVNGEIRVKQATKQGYIIAINGDSINLSFPNSKTRRGRVIKQKSPTLDRGCDVCIYYNNIIRRLTITELERLQTIPDNYTNVENINDRMKKSAIGNGWTIDVISYILSFLNK